MHWIPVILISTVLSGATWAQQNMDISVMGGLSQSTTSAVNGTTTQVTAPVGPSIEINYGYQILRRSAVELWLETPMVFGYLSSAATVGPGNISAASSSMFAFTPGVRVRIPTQSRLSVYAIGGFGYGSFARYQVLVQPGIVQAQSRLSFHPTFDAGAGADIRLTRLVSLRAELRDLIPTGSLNGGTPRNHIFYEFGIAFHF